MTFIVLVNSTPGILWNAVKKTLTFANLQILAMHNTYFFTFLSGNVNLNVSSDKHRVYRD